MELIISNVHTMLYITQRKQSVTNGYINISKYKYKDSVIKNKTNKVAFITHTNLKIKKLPVLTRWGTYIIFCEFIYTKYQRIKNWINSLGTDERETKNLFNSIDRIFFL